MATILLLHRLVLLVIMTRSNLGEARMRAYFDQNRFTLEQTKAAAEAEDAVACKKCGRVIYCGASTLCIDPDCGKKNGNKER